MRSVLQLRTPQNGDGGRAPTDGMNLEGAVEEVDSMKRAAIPEPPAPRVRFRDPQIEMAHGAGGKASRKLVEELFAPLLFGSSTQPLADAAQRTGSGVGISAVPHLRF